MIEYRNERERQMLFVIGHLRYEYLADLGSLLTSFKFLHSFWNSFMKAFSKEIKKFTIMFISSFKMSLNYHPYNLKRGRMY